MIDQYGRRVTYLRVSLTNRCQLSCTYCTLQDEPAEVMTPDEIETILRVASDRLGFRKVRLTGGEPTLRRDLPDIVRRIDAIPGIREVALTTNAMLLERRAAELHAAGLRTVNVSLDTLRPERFKELTGSDGLADVLAGLRAARDIGIPNVKVNAVLMGGVNDDEVADFVRFAATERIEVRFIEHMPMDSERVERWKVEPREVLAALAGEAGVQPLPARQDGGPAERFRVGEATIGFIHAMSNPFCDRCNRLRITAEGTIRSCLLTGGEVDLKSAIRAGGSAAEVERRVEQLFRQAADMKPPIYDLQREGGIAMRAIGG
ncbi:GTP 3',8-cyclase MoaA [Engelhardtia mirabilis]|uniref:GTP 3',8-cyclase n=1 Tax=Engelhardtia mirabilis TaxID=2528011 RepID=A0A518BJY8_9BACT|nr:Cyclic pyranopterin monophosphate synthase [Planctomycetes bacterium Pla133]QDV01607.1 Cyclic pyranopterin monophosphate synthase [Planctomycetes bacterium Pla86]